MNTQHQTIEHALRSIIKSSRSIEDDDIRDSIRTDASDIWAAMVDIEDDQETVEIEVEHSGVEVKSFGNTESILDNIRNGKFKFPSFPPDFPPSSERDFHDQYEKDILPGAKQKPEKKVGGVSYDICVFVDGDIVKTHVKQRSVEDYYGIYKSYKPRKIVGWSAQWMIDDILTRVIQLHSIDIDKPINYKVTAFVETQPRKAHEDSILGRTSDFDNLYVLRRSSLLGLEEARSYKIWHSVAGIDSYLYVPDDIYNNITSVDDLIGLMQNAESTAEFGIQPAKEHQSAC